MNELNFNPAPSRVLHLDLNSCFATIEQQANPALRGKPIAVAAFTTPGGCILAASIEAKRLGIKTGMRVRDGKAIFPGLIVLPPDPWKYRNVHLALRNLVSEYTTNFLPKSIDEFVLNLEKFVSIKGSPQKVALEIKQRIKKEIGEWLTISVGIAPNRYLAKVAAGLHKPDGLDEINQNNFLKIYSNLALTDLTGIKTRNAARLASVGIYSVLDFYKAPVWRLQAAFHSVNGLYWHIRLSGHEIDDVEFGRRSYGNSTAIGKNLSRIEELAPILARLTEKACSRLRAAGYRARGVHLMVTYKNGSWWHRGRLMSQSHSDSREFYKAAFRLLVEAKPNSPVLNIAVSFFRLTRGEPLQLEIFGDTIKKEKLVAAGDSINSRWGDFTLATARSFGGSSDVKDRIAFGGVKELEELLNLQP